AAGGVLMSVSSRLTVWVWFSSLDEVKDSELGLPPLSLPQAIRIREAGMARRIPPTRKMTSRRFILETMSGGPGTSGALRCALSPSAPEWREESGGVRQAASALTCGGLRAIRPALSHPG